ncbi:MAG: hypothetical protein HGB26_04940 [Desulfobulbaceae bacterium]|nr:hypothetical protein [Desulfobulbaceae bacterium]
MIKNCLNCHFLSKENRENGRTLSFSLREEEREKLAIDPVGFDRGWYSYKCYMGVWDEGVSPVSKDEDQIIFSQDRGDSCYFFNYRPSMLFKTAIELQRREIANSKTEPTRETNMNQSHSSVKHIWDEIENDFDISKRTFGKKINFVTDTFKKKIIFRDIEHAYVLANLGYAKPAVILAGSVIEELLRLYLIEKKIKPPTKTFDAYIQTCEQNGLLKSGISRLTDSVRHFRNIVHLQKEENSKITISKATAKGAVTSIFTIANDF